jgi:A/G-specific adenine glycosylase
LEFSNNILAWYEQHGRKDLPWQQSISAYRVWVSEIMLQQTQVTTVIPYYDRFMGRFPDIAALAQADQDQVLHYWSGLGYYARARHLHAAAETVVEDHGGQFPESFEAVLALPGIGRSTAGAILSLAFGQRHPILDGNVKRVLARCYSVEGWPGQSRVQKELWQLAELYTPDKHVAAYTQAIMDLGATVCTRTNPACIDCPLSNGCMARINGRQADFPSPRPRKHKPVRETTMLLLTNDRNEVVIEKRPAVGIWGGLWSFPEISPGDAVDVWCRDAAGFSVNRTEQWPVVRHTFSHFHLDITPVIAIAGIPLSRVMDGGDRLWYNINSQDELGFAAPVGKLLGRLAEWQEQ